jgi:hypothetical protein
MHDARMPCSRRKWQASIGQRERREAKSAHSGEEQQGAAEQGRRKAEQMTRRKGTGLAERRSDGLDGQKTTVTDRKNE